MLLLLACAPEPPPAPVTMEPGALLARASLDLRGVRPAAAELEGVRANPETLDARVQQYLLDPRLAERVLDLYAPVWLTRAEELPVDAGDFGVADEAAFLRDVGQEPLRMLAHIAVQDLPYTELVTADWTVLNETLSGFLPTDYPPAERGWRVTRYTDGRPAVGALGTASFLLRYPTNGFNANRGRANAASRILLCNDYLERPIAFDRDVDLLDEEAVRHAIRLNTGCAGCHHSLDPLGGFFWGFFHLHGFSPYDYTWYHPEREFMWQTLGESAPGYFGQPVEEGGMTELGALLAADPRLVECAVEQATEQLLGRPVTLDDTEALVRRREVFLAAGLRLRPLFEDVVADPAYRNTPSSAPGGVRKRMSPALLASVVEDLTGYRFVVDGYDMLDNDSVGLRVLAGGIDSNLVTRPAELPTATLLLVQERIAEGAAFAAVQRDAGAAAPRLFTEVDPATAGAAPDRTTQLDTLYLRVLSRPPTDAERARDLALWDELHALSGDPAVAWAGLLAALLRDPEALFY